MFYLLSGKKQYIPSSYSFSHKKGHILTLNCTIEKNGTEQVQILL